MKQKPLIAIIGESTAEPHSSAWQLAEETGKLLIENEYRLICGGRSGVMEAACKGAQSTAKHQSGDVIGLLPDFEPNRANPYVDIVIPSALGPFRNGIIANSSAVIAIGGGAGTLSEMAFAWAFHRLIIGYAIDGWSGKLAGQKIDERIRYPQIPEDCVFAADTAIEAMALLEKWLPHYQQRNSGIRNS